MKKYSGFTLIELFITLIVVGVLLAIGVPSLKSFLQKGQLIASTNELVSAFHVARSEAIKINNSVTICESSNGTSCNDPATGNWKNGWIVFVDSNTDQAGTGAACAAANTDCLLRVHAGIADGQMALSGVNAGNVAVRSVTFDSRGLPRNAAGASMSGKFSLCSYDGDNSVIASRVVVLSLAGRVRVSDNAAVISCPETP
jgi:type IV fimbrial biogenesis protein FimT